MPETTKCWNYRINLEMCTCTNESCENRGICCLCVANHAGNEQYPLTACMRTERPEETMSLPKETTIHCWAYEKNLENCACKSEDCVRKGTCCDCIRNHWKPDGTGRPACLREAVA